MRAPQSFIVSPKHKKYKEGKKVGEVVFQTTTSIEDAKDVSQEGIVVAVPMNYKGSIKAGDEVIIHHNIFRAYYNQQGRLTFSRAYLYNDLYTVIPEEIFLYKQEGQWKSFMDVCFVKPLTEDKISTLKGQQLPHTGMVQWSNVHPTDTVVGFTPESEYVVEVDGEKYYKMRDIDVCIYDRFER